MKHKTAELEGALLDAAVTKILGRGVHDTRYVAEMHDLFGKNAPLESFAPHRRWEHAGPLIEREGMTVSPTHGRVLPPRTTADVWRAVALLSPSDIMVVGEGPTPLIAAMRAYVASKFGEEIDLP